MSAETETVFETYTEYGLTNEPDPGSDLYFSRNRSHIEGEVSRGNVLRHGGSPYRMVERTVTVTKSEWRGTSQSPRRGHPECWVVEPHEEHGFTVGNGLRITCKGRD